jgi:hypothetical protein
MGIRLSCPNGHKLHLKSFLAGRRGICPHCGARFDIPGERLPDSPPHTLRAVDSNPSSLEMASGERPPAKHGSSAALAALDVDRLLGISGGKDVPAAIEEAPAAQWYVRLPSGEQFGPAAGPMMLGWLAEERVPDAAHVWREGWTDWRLAGSVFGDRAVSQRANATPTPVFAETVIERDLQVSPKSRAALGRVGAKRTLSNRVLVAVLALAVLLLVPVLIWVIVQQ